MKRNLSLSDVAEALLNDKSANWSVNGAYALAEVMEQYEEDSGKEFQLDVVALRCEWSEYESATEAAKDFGWDEGGGEEEALSWLEDFTVVFEFDGGVIVQNR